MSGSTFGTLIALDDQLAGHGVPPLSAWWRDTLREWYEHPSALDLVVCAGRGAAKSSALYKVTLNETLFGDFAIPPGERHWASLSSRAKSEASKALDILGHWLSFLRVPHTRGDGAIELHDMPRGILILAASVGGNTGWRTFFDGNDETGKWPAEGTGNVDAREVLTSKRAMSITHGNARRVIVSTPFVNSGPFFDLVHEGTTERQIVKTAPTWIASPHVSEARTRQIERDEKQWAREYKAEFGQALSAAFEADAVRAAVRRCGVAWSNPVLTLDTAGTGSDQLTWGFVQRFRDIDGAIRVRLGALNALDGAARKQFTSETALDYVTATARKAAGATRAIGDQYGAWFLVPALQRRGFHYETLEWTNESKLAAVARIRMWLRDRTLVVDPGPEAERWQREMISFREKLTSTGFTTFGARSNGHDDFVALAVNAAMADALGMLPLAGEGIAAPSPMMLTPSPTGFEDLVMPTVITGPTGNRQFRNADEAADALRDSELRRSGSAGARPEDHATRFGVTTKHDLLEGF